MRELDALVMSSINLSYLAIPFQLVVVGPSASLAGAMNATDFTLVHVF